MLLRQIGDLDGSIRSLEQAARFWSDLPASPFADNAELVQSLLYRDESSRAELLANTGVMRTIPWARPQAEALYGAAAVQIHQGRFSEAADVLFASLACHAARRRGDVLQGIEQRALLDALDAIPWAPTCPHGRPVAVPFALADIDLRFGRR